MSWLIFDDCLQLYPQPHGARQPQGAGVKQSFSDKVCVGTHHVVAVETSGEGEQAIPRVCSRMEVGGCLVERMQIIGWCVAQCGAV